MTLLDPTQGDDTITPQHHKAPRGITVIVRAEFPNITPAHNRYITKQGSGSNLDRAIRDAWGNVMKDARLRGKRAQGCLPIKATVQFISQGDEGE